MQPPRFKLRLRRRRHGGRWRVVVASGACDPRAAENNDRKSNSDKAHAKHSGKQPLSKAGDHDGPQFQSDQAEATNEKEGGARACRRRSVKKRSDKARASHSRKTAAGAKRNVRTSSFVPNRLRRFPAVPGRCSERVRALLEDGTILVDPGGGARGPHAAVPACSILLPRSPVRDTAKRLSREPDR